MTPVTRLCVRLLRIHGKSFTEIANTLNISGPGAFQLARYLPCAPQGEDYDAAMRAIRTMTLKEIGARPQADAVWLILQTEAAGVLLAPALDPQVPVVDEAPAVEEAAPAPPTAPPAPPAARSKRSRPTKAAAKPAARRKRPVREPRA